ncbi:hypothetical protein, partial [Stenotrophomonas maltophilia group sp. RNC7]|uniref:hypothetical protein n=1 Tax=Stenotrophomonas maltophilia group sp. RNC7 TaxID=3071467 RepID=UPI0027DF6673
LIQSGGTLEIGGGELIVAGDYRIQSKQVASNGTVTYSASSGYLKMTQASDVVEIGGQFIMQSQYSHEGWLTAGTMDLKGHFTQLSASVSDNFRTSGAHKVILSGHQQQVISMNSDNSSFFNILKMSNTSGEGVKFATRVYVNKELQPTTTPIVDGHNLILTTNVPISWASWHANLGLDGNRSLQQDVTIEGDLHIYGGTIHLNGHKLTVKGSLYQLGGMLDLAGGEVQVQGNVVHSGGTLAINEGQLNVEGSYRMQSERVDANGTVTYGYSHGGLQMIKASD